MKEIDGAMAFAGSGFICLILGVRDAARTDLRTPPESNLALGVFLFAIGLFLGVSMLFFVANRRQK